MARRSSATLNRILQAIPVLIGVVVISFVLTRALPGDPAVQFAGAAATPESIEEVRRSLGLDKPFSVQFALWIKGVVVGDFGTSLFSGHDVSELYIKRIPATLSLTVAF